MLYTLSVGVVVFVVKIVAADIYIYICISPPSRSNMVVVMMIMLLP